MSTFRPYLRGTGDRARKRDLAAAAAFAGLSALLLAIPAAYRDAVGHAVRSSVLYPVMAMQHGASDREGRYADAARLRAERDSLASFLVGQSNLAEENRELRALLGFRPRLTYSFVSAETDPVTGPGSAGTLRLSVGSRDGVKQDAPLVTASGLVGKVWKLGSTSSVAIDWTHDKFAVAVMTVDGETYGIATPANDQRGERVLALTPVAFHTVPDTGSLRGDLTALGRAVAANIGSDVGSAMTKTLVAAAATSPAVAEATHSFWAERLRLTGEIVTRATARGELPADVDANVVIEALVGALYVRLLLTGEPLDAAVADQVAGAVAAGFAVPT